MATVDYVATVGGKAMNFSDIGGAFVIDQAQCLLRMFEEESTCRVILINLFGGILDMDSFAASIEDLIVRLRFKLTKPMVIRLRGRNVEGATLRLQKYMDLGQLNIQFVGEFDEVCEMAVEIAAKAEE